MPKVPRLLAPVIERIPHSRAYQVTADGLAIAWTLFFTRLAQRLLIPGLAQLTDPSPPPGMRLRQAARAYQAAITELAQPAGIHRRLTPTVTTAGLVHGPKPPHTPQLDSKFKIPAGKDNLLCFCQSTGSDPANTGACGYTTAVPAAVTLAACTWVSGVTGCCGVRYEPRSWLSTPNTTA